MLQVWLKTQMIHQCATVNCNILVKLKKKNANYIEISLTWANNDYLQITTTCQHRLSFLGPIWNIYCIIVPLNQCFSTGGSRPTYGSRFFTLGRQNPSYHCLMGRQIVYYTVLWVTNYQRLRTTALNNDHLLITTTIGAHCLVCFGLNVYFHKTTIQIF